MMSSAAERSLPRQRIHRSPRPRCGNLGILRKEWAGHYRLLTFAETITTRQHSSKTQDQEAQVTQLHLAAFQQNDSVH